MIKLNVMNIYIGLALILNRKIELENLQKAQIHVLKKEKKRRVKKNLQKYYCTFVQIISNKISPGRIF